MKRRLRNLAFVAYIIVFCFAAGEIIIRVSYERFRNYNMEMWRYASDLKQPLEDHILPFHHFPNKVGDYYGVNISTNSLGLRDNEYSLKKPANKKRIVVLGDSFVLGWGVPFEDTFSKVLERMLNQETDNYEVVNMGIGNYNSTMEVELLKWKGLDLDPDMAVLMYFVNDTEPIPQQKSCVTYTIIKHSYFWSFLFDRLVRLRSRFIKTFEWVNYYRDLYSEENSENLAANAESIRELIRLCRQHDIMLLIVNLPELHEFKEYQLGFATEHIRGLAEEGNVPFLDLLPAFTDCEPESLWVSLEDHHANAKANSIIAQHVHERIVQDGMLE